MRKLTVNIRANPAARVGKVFLYIEDDGGNTRISGTLCKKLGEIKEGSSEIFKVDNGNLKLFVIPEQQSQNFEYNPFRLPVGEDDIYISGENKVDANGKSGFVMSIAKPESATAKVRKKSNPVVVIITVILAMLIGSTLGFFVTKSIINAVKDSDKVFKVEDLSITLTGHFTPEDHNGYKKTFASKDVAIFVSCADFSNTQGFSDITPAEYLDMLIQGNEAVYDFENVGVGTDDGIPFFSYTHVSSANEREYSHYVYAYKDGNSVWTVEFAVETVNKDMYLDKITDWAHTVEFK